MGVFSGIAPNSIMVNAVVSAVVVVSVGTFVLGIRSSQMPDNQV